MVARYSAALTATRIVVVDRNPAALKLAEQLGAHHTVVADGGQIVLCNLDKKLDQIFVITKLALVFDAYASEKEALEAFTQAA